MRPRTLLILTLLIAGLGLFVWLVDRDLPSTDERRELEQRVLPIEADDVGTIVIDQGESSARLERSSEAADGSSSEWRLTLPLDARADGERVRSLLDELTGLEKGRTLSDVVPAELGLDPPRSVLTLVADGVEWRLAVGSDVPASRDVVVSVEGRGTFVTESRFLDEIEREPGEWRDRRVIPGGRNEIRAARVSSPGGELVLARSADRFALEVPLRDDADDERVSELFGALAELEVDEWVDGGDLSAPGLALDPPIYEVAVTLEGREAPLMVRLGATEVDGVRRFGVVEGQLFKVETELPALLDRPSSWWQSLAWTDLEAFEIDSIRLTASGLQAGLERAEGEWLRDGEVISYSAVRELIDSIVGLRGDRAIEDEGSRDSDPRALLELEAGDRTESLTIWPSGTGGFVAGREGRHYLLELPPEPVSEVMAAIEAVLSAAPEPAGDAAG